MLPKPTRSDRVGESGALGSCADFFAVLDKKSGEAGVLDPGEFRVENYPYLRVNRFLASFHEEVEDPAAFEAWTDRLQALDRDARRYEIDNLPDPAVAIRITSYNVCYTKLLRSLKSACFKRSPHAATLS